MTRALPLGIAILLAGCGEQDPDPCVEMCQAAADLYGGCLEGWGLDWTAAGYDDEADYLGSCETWGWEMRALEAQAIRDGDAEAGAVDGICVERTALLSAEDAECSAYTDIDWNTAPWERADTGLR